MTHKKLNILFLTYQGGMAGSTLSIIYLAKGLAERGHEIFVGMREEMPIWNEMDHPGITRVAMRINGKFDFQNWKEIRDLVRAHKIDIVNAQSSHDRYTSIFANWFYRLKTQVVHTRRQMPLSMGGPVQKWLYNKKTAGIVAVSTPVKDALVKLGFNEPHITVISNGTPKEKYEHPNPNLVAELKAKYNIKEGDFVIGCVSRPKEQEQILNALKFIKEPVKMIFAGIEAEERFTQHLEEFQVDHKVYFEGAVPSEEILSYYQIFDVKILASTMEGLSQSLLEAMALGTPVIATAYAGNLDLIKDGQNGLFFEDGDAEQLAVKIKLLRSNAALRTKLIQAGKVTALETFSIENTIKNYEQYFTSLLDQNH